MMMDDLGYSSPVAKEVHEHIASLYRLKDDLESTGKTPELREVNIFLTLSDRIMELEPSCKEGLYFHCYGVLSCALNDDRMVDIINKMERILYEKEMHYWTIYPKEEDDKRAEKLLSMVLDKFSLTVEIFFRYHDGSNNPFRSPELFEEFLRNVSCHTKRLSSLYPQNEILRSFLLSFINSISRGISSEQKYRIENNVTILREDADAINRAMSTYLPSLVALLPDGRKTLVEPFLNLASENQKMSYIRFRLSKWFPSLAHSSSNEKKKRIGDGTKKSDSLDALRFLSITCTDMIDSVLPYFKHLDNEDKDIFAIHISFQELKQEIQNLEQNFLEDDDTKAYISSFLNTKLKIFLEPYISYILEHHGKFIGNDTKRFIYGLIKMHSIVLSETKRLTSHAEKYRNIEFDVIEWEMDTYIKNNV